MGFSEKSTSHFVAEISERQISAREFFSVVLLDALQRDFGLNKAVILIFDTDGKFLSWITKHGTEIDNPNHAYSKIMNNDKMRQIIYQEAVRDELTYFNQEPRIYRASDYYGKNQYEKSRFVNCIEEQFGGHYAISLAFGINAYIQISFFKSREEGDYSEEEVEEFKEIYHYIAVAYAGFKRHEQAKIISNIQDEIICSGERAYLITDDFMHIMSINKEAVRLLAGILGQSIACQIENRELCLWLPFLLGGEEGKIEEGRVVIKEVKNLIFKIYTYNQDYSHGIIDRYHWITISQKNPESQKRSLEISLTPSEKNVARLLCDGLTYQKIADELCISYHTVKNHVQNIFSKYEVSNRYELYKILENNM